MLHAEQRALLGRARPRREPAPADEADELVERARTEVRAVLSRLEGPRRGGGGGERARPPPELRLEGRGLPIDPRVAGLHRLVAGKEEAPFQVEAVDLVPVALAERVGEAAVDRPPAKKADNVHPL